MTFTCPECGEECTVREDDQGVGYTEAWGRPHNDVHKVVISECCEAPINDDQLQEFEDEQFDRPDDD